MLERSLCWWWPRLYYSLELSPSLQNKISGLFLPRLPTLHMHNTELGISHKPVLSFVFRILYSLSPVVSLPDGSLRIILNVLIFCPPTRLPISNNLWSPVTTFQSCCALYSPSSSAGLGLSIHFFSSLIDIISSRLPSLSVVFLALPLKYGMKCLLPIVSLHYVILGSAFISCQSMSLSLWVP